MFGSSIESDMTTSSEKANYNFLETKKSSERSVSKIPKRNNTIINNPKNHYNTIRSEIINKTGIPIRNYPQSSVKPDHEAIHSNAFKSQNHDKNSKKMWAIQPTEQTKPSRKVYTIGKHNVKQNCIGQSKKINPKLHTKMQKHIGKMMKIMKII